MSDVAKAAGVSAATVSRALRGEPGVSEATRQHVSDVARRMKYAIARDASSLAGGRRYAIAVLTSEVSPVLAGAEGALRQAGYDVLLYVLGDAGARAKFFDELPLGRRVDGVLLLSLTMSAAERAALESLEVPHVTVDDTDLRHALQTAVSHVVSLGHRDVALVLSDGEDEGYDEILISAGLEVRPEWTVWCSPTVDGGEQVVDVLLDGERLPTAVISSNGAAAVGIFLRVQRDGRAVPDEVSIVSLDGQELTRVVGLTAVEGAAKEQGERAVADLFTLIRGGEIEPAEHPLRLVVRNSSGPVAAAG
ncbi:LacI family DNA-binding transcriptional regulator [Lentzea sp. HUAS12]|uniref:LacI family DNA-binding transcriptional regulator n=1 Tax=Lentzea sp. HUAS12 TaxID=2951806 RepID=UPI00209DECA4|nr:LacI family DNA-binding transcriptional regulator [Lentzea sp. HUAS12]USX56553.1 LacI family transcriptional regulator [Lentzea sp. HUAS12]